VTVCSKSRHGADSAHVAMNLWGTGALWGRAALMYRLEFSRPVGALRYLLHVLSGPLQHLLVWTAGKIHRFSESQQHVWYPGLFRLEGTRL